MSFRVSCNYDPKAADLQLSIDGAISVKNPQIYPHQTNQILHGIVKSPTCFSPAFISEKHSTFQLDGQSLDRLGRFQKRTVLSIGTTKGSLIYKNEIIKLAFVVRTHIEKFNNQTDPVFCI
jgi:hypothetical protein